MSVRPPELAPASPHHTVFVRVAPRSDAVQPDNDPTKDCERPSCQKRRIDTVSHDQACRMTRLALLSGGRELAVNLHGWFPSPHRGSGLLRPAVPGEAIMNRGPVWGPCRSRISRWKSAPPTGPTYEPQPQALWVGSSHGRAGASLDSVQPSVGSNEQPSPRRHGGSLTALVIARVRPGWQRLSLSALQATCEW